MITIAILRAAGLSEAQIVRVLELEEQSISPGAWRQRRWRERLNCLARDASVSDETPETLETQKSESNQSSDRHGDVTPSKSTLSLKKERKKDLKKESTAKRGERIPAGWNPPDRDWEFAIAAVGEITARANLDKFRDYWTAIPGQKGVKLDWSATWRNWIRRVAETTPNTQSPQVNENAQRLLRETEEYERTRKLKLNGHHQGEFQGEGFGIHQAELGGDGTPDDQAWH